MIKKLYIITGISSGLGKEIFGLLRKEDNYILAIDKEKSNIKEKNIKIENLNFLYSPAPSHVLIRNESFILKEDVDEIIFINNAGTIVPIKKIGEFDEDEFNANIKINFIAPSALINTLVRITINKKKLKIINISSGNINFNSPGLSAYTCSKLAFKKYLDILKFETPDIDVRHFFPPAMDTPMQETIREINFPIYDKTKKPFSKEDLKNPKSVAIEVLDLI
jgi:benzil reductase ((S)-benzoin forming)